MILRRHPFLVFAAAVAIAVGLVIAFIQSDRFAGAVRGVVARALPPGSGVNLEFDGIRVRLFPPGLAATRPRLSVSRANALGLPPGLSFAADELHLVFLPLQAFSGGVRVNEARLIGGEVRWVLGARELSNASEGGAARRGKPGGGRGLGMGWEDLLQLRIDAVRFQDVKLALATDDTVPEDKRFGVDAEVSRLLVAREGPGFAVDIELRRGALEAPAGVTRVWGKIPELQRLTGTARVDGEGVLLSGLRAEIPGVALDLSGRITGDVLRLGDRLALDGDVRVVGRLEAMRADLGTGDAEFNGHLSGDLLRPEAISARGSLRLAQARVRGWRIDRAGVEAEWGGWTTGGELSVRSAVFEADPAERAPGRPGTGGRLELAPFRLRLREAAVAPAESDKNAEVKADKGGDKNSEKNADEGVELKARLARAHVHWLTGPMAERIFPLELRADGEVRARLRLPTRARAGWSLAAEVELEVPALTLDNQRAAERRPLTRVLEPRPIMVSGRIGVDAREVRIEGVRLGLPKSELQVTGRVGLGSEPADGFDLRGQGSVDLDDLRRLAGREIRGRGRLAVRVHGPRGGPTLEFDPDLLDGYYLDLDLGQVRGHLALNLENDRLVFDGARVTRGRSTVGVEGHIDLGVADRMALTATLPAGTDMSDVLPIARPLTREFWWLPDSVVGPVRGEIKFGGGVGLARMEIQADLQGDEWAFWGERFRRTRLVGGYDRGRFHADLIRLEKRAGGVEGRVSYRMDTGELDWDARTRDLTLADFDRVARLDLPIRGRVLLTTQGKGVGRQIISESFAAVSDLSIRGRPLPPSQLKVESRAGELHLAGSGFAGQGRLQADYGLEPGAESRIQLKLEGFDFVPALLLLNPSLLEREASLVGRASLAADLRFPSGEFERATGDLSFTEYRLAKPDASFTLESPVHWRLDRGTAEVRSATLVGSGGRDGGSRLKFEAGARAGELDARLDGSLRLALAEFITPAVVDAGGSVLLDGRIRGPLKGPEVDVVGRVADASFRHPAVEAPFENARGTATLRQNVLRLTDISADLGGGRVQGGGTIGLFPNQAPALDLRGEILAAKLPIWPFTFIRISGPVEVKGDAAPYLVTGKLLADSGLSREKVLTQRSVQGLRALQYAPDGSGEGAGWFKLDVGVRSDGGILVQNDLFDVEVKADLRVVNTPEVPRFLGTTAITQGKLLFKDHQFRIESASARFDNPAVIDPSFTLNSVTEVGGVRVQLFADGRLSDMKITLSSNPVLSENEIISLLALGVNPSDARRFGAADRAVVERGEAAALLLHSLDFNREVQDRTGFQIKLDESSNPAAGASAFRPQTASDAGASPKIVVKRRIGKNLDVSYGSTVGVGGSSQREASAEYQVTPGFSVIGVYDNYGTVDTKDRTESYGVDLKLQKRFK